MAATAANDSWKPGSNSVYGFHARSTSAPSRKKCQRSTGRAASHASETRAPETPARMTDGCAPTASTYVAMAPRAPTSPSQRGMPSSHASASAPPATSTTFCPETASRRFTLSVMDVDGYIRVSRRAGREGDSYISPKLQSEQIEGYAKLYGLRIMAWHTDEDVSGGTLDRRGLAVALERCRNGETGGIVSARLD